MTETFFDRYSRDVPMLAILRGFDPGQTVALCHQLWDLGFSLVEVPIQNEVAIEALRVAVRAGAERGLVVGAGTVVSSDLVKIAVDVGAAFTVAPGLDLQVAAASVDAGLPHLPGVATATEVHRALKAGFAWLKAFPAGQLGTNWAKEMHGPFPQAKFVSTGGVTAENAIEYLDGGASMVAFASALADPDQRQELAALAQQLHGSR